MVESNTSGELATQRRQAEALEVAKDNSVAPGGDPLPSQLDHPFVLARKMRSKAKIPVETHPSSGPPTLPIDCLVDAKFPPELERIRPS